MYVSFPGATRKTGELEEAVYPVEPVKRTRHLDTKRKKPQQAVRKHQLPLMPTFAITAYGAQGQTIAEGVIADLVLAKCSSILTAYVALTRVTARFRLPMLRIRLGIFSVGWVQNLWAPRRRHPDKPS